MLAAPCWTRGEAMGKAGLWVPRLLVSAVITKLGAFCDSGRGSETGEEMLAWSR